MFFCSGRGKGEFEAPGGVGDRFFIENSRMGGGGFSRTGEVPRGREGVCGESGNFLGGGGGLNIFFGAEMSTKMPSGTKLLRTKNVSEIIIFGKLRSSHVIP